MAEQKKAAVLTGAARGMGASHAKTLAAEGWHVCVADVLDPTNTVEAINSAGGNATGYELDVTDEASWESLVEKIQEEGLPVSALVNNAGVSYRKGIAETTVEKWNFVNAVNVTGPFLGMKHIAPLIRESGGGSIVNISSTSGIVGYHAAAYTASKWGLRGLTKTGAFEYAPWNIRVNSVHPGVIDTPMVAGADAFVSASLESVPFERAGQPEEVSNAISFLLSDKSTYMNGSEVVVDGGLTSAGMYWKILKDANARSQGGDM
ncbi:SDR family oxidoreductase [Brevibacterium ravenspurgense]|uniref:SDR family NAD(P)-dependent oxidoreductase n=1 Tax=Brevibacterium ravenspurgense TaxID=479117 RepID=UPI001EF195BB|nr:SDR family oxidoreductase [Brevibacterium ravenspurgense]MCG7300564.1 SDR family oxidoreductase [Brevibacterium ravenspurgense]